jgi:ABC-type transport system involved in multi-copper enzyme maturation permease subunit
MYFEAHTGYAVIFHGLTLVMAAVLSATAIAQEKESDTWTLLLATPISGSAIVWGKALGVLRRLIVPMGFFICHFLLFTAVGVLNFGAVALVAWVMFSFNSLWIATGIYLSVRLRKVTAAVIVNLMLAVVLYLVVPIVMAIFGDVARSDGLGRQGCWPLPFYYLVFGIQGLKHWNGLRTNYSYDTYNLPYSGREAVSGLEFFVAVIAIGVIYLAVSALILSRTARRFDHFVARAPQKKRGGINPALPQPV